ncbi:LPXTG cell wall anchor domain-containing protein [Streptococcus himalayensis]|uniref:Gram-positive cocci surface proteins LPxTG domain-containing protein n=1 Tax=Streptococcus himalayensis TaxID=1888195 RepID=A0A917A8E2_9STRE|nr:LPXTG cell wall anchor domain-containing protein [Streptococcus himalayensis]GGE32903.1 hypothetical protein GCM10011510_12800 [Streptococcus himalayensis]
MNIKKIAVSLTTITVLNTISPLVGVYAEENGVPMQTSSDSLAEIAQLNQELEQLWLLKQSLEYEVGVLKFRLLDTDPNKEPIPEGGLRTYDVDWKQLTEEEKQELRKQLAEKEPQLGKIESELKTKRERLEQALDTYLQGKVQKEDSSYDLQVILAEYGLSFEELSDYIVTEQDKIPPYKFRLTKPDGKLAETIGRGVSAYDYIHTFAKAWADYKAEHGSIPKKNVPLPIDKENSAQPSETVASPSGTTTSQPVGTDSTLIAEIPLGAPSAPSVLQGSSAGVTVTVSSQDAERIKSIRSTPVTNAQLPNGLSMKDVDLYDINPLDENGNVVQFSENATVTLPVAKGRKVLKVIYYLPETGTIEDLAFRYDARTNQVIFTMSQFSQYGIVYEPENASSTSQTAAKSEKGKLLPKTGDHVSLLGFVGAGLLSMLGLAYSRKSN